MNARALAIALAVSVAVNLFAVAAGVTVLLGQARLEKQVEQQQKPGGDRSVGQILRTVDPEVRREVREALRASTSAAKPDFQQARELRRQAIAMAQAETYDATQVSALLARSRAAELSGRTRLETDSVAILATLQPDDRKALSVLLNRHRRNRDRDREPREVPPAVVGEKG